MIVDSGEWRVESGEWIVESGELWYVFATRKQLKNPPYSPPWRGGPQGRGGCEWRS